MLLYIYIVYHLDSIDCVYIYYFDAGVYQELNRLDQNTR